MLEKINPTFNRATRHKAIGKRVVVTAGSFKGYTGYVEAHNYVRNTFLVDLVTSMKRNIAAEDLIYQWVWFLPFTFLKLNWFAEKAVSVLLRTLQPLTLCPPVPPLLHPVNRHHYRMAHSFHLKIRTTKPGLFPLVTPTQLMTIGQLVHQASLPVSDHLSYQLISRIRVAHSNLFPDRSPLEWHSWEAHSGCLGAEIWGRESHRIH